MNSATENNRMASQLKKVTLDDHPNCQIFVMYKKFLVKGRVPIYMKNWSKSVLMYKNKLSFLDGPLTTVLI